MAVELLILTLKLAVRHGAGAERIAGMTGSGGARIAFCVSNLALNPAHTAVSGPKIMAARIWPLKSRPFSVPFQKRLAC